MKKIILTFTFILLTSFCGVLLVGFSFFEMNFTMLAIPRIAIILGGSFVLNVFAWHLFNRILKDKKSKISYKSLFYIDFILAGLLFGLSALTYVLMQRDGTFSLDEMMQKPAVFLAVGCLYFGAAIGVAIAYKRNK